MCVEADRKKLCTLGMDLLGILIWIFLISGRCSGERLSETDRIQYWNRHHEVRIFVLSPFFLLTRIYAVATEMANRK
jgi:hypothetical protein